MNVLSLFDGMSCGRIALDRAGIPTTTYYASEIDKYATKVSQDNYQDIVRLGDITHWKKWGLDWGSIDLVLAGSPCQGFSFAGKQLAFDDPRSALFFTFVDILTHIRKHNTNVKFMLENVKMKKDYLDVITDTLGVESVFINSSLVSAQNRQRYYWCNWHVEQPADKKIYLADILEEDGTGWIKSHGEWKLRNEKSQCIDANYHKGVDNHGQRTMIKCGSMIGRRINPATGKRDDYNKSITPIQTIELRSDDKTGTLTTVQKDNLLVKQHKAAGSVQYRKLTPIECERLQTVPDGYTACVSNTQRYKMLGNGWTVDVIAHILSQLNKQPVKVTKWYDIDSDTEQYGFKIHHPKHGWVNAADSNGLLTFASEEERDKYIEKWIGLPCQR